MFSRGTSPGPGADPWTQLGQIPALLVDLRRRNHYLYIKSFLGPRLKVSGRLGPGSDAVIGSHLHPEENPETSASSLALCGGGSGGGDDGGVVGRGWVSPHRSLPG